MQLQLLDDQVAYLLKDAEDHPENTVLQNIAKVLNDRTASNSDEIDDKYRAAAAEQYEHEGTLEIDPDAPVSLSDDPGAYVQAWVWVDASSIGLNAAEEDEADDNDDEEEEKDCEDDNTCRKCGEPAPLGCDGWDGMCPSCADRAEAARAAEDASGEEESD